jgi:hypothetical protein
VQAMGQHITAEAFRWMAVCGCQFLVVMVEVDSVYGTIVAPGSPSLDETMLRGFIELGTMLQSCGPDWLEAPCADRHHLHRSLLLLFLSRWWGCQMPQSALCCAGQKFAWT